MLICYLAVLADEVECPFFKASASNSIILLSLSHVDVFYDACRHFTDIAMETDFSLCQLLPHIAGDRSHDKDNDDHQNRTLMGQLPTSYDNNPVHQKLSCQF